LTDSYATSYRDYADGFGKLTTSFVTRVYKYMRIYL
jgi:hypothetical protein